MAAALWLAKNFAEMVCTRSGTQETALWGVFETYWEAAFWATAETPWKVASCGSG